MTFMMLAEIRADGVILRREGDQLRVVGNTKAAARHMDWIKANKAEILTILRQETLGVVDYHNQKVCAVIARFLDVAGDHPSATIALQIDKAYCLSWDHGKEVARRLLPDFETAIGYLSGEELANAISEEFSKPTKPNLGALLA